jgi:hypothetical protein
MPKRQSLEWPALCAHDASAIFGLFFFNQNVGAISSRTGNALANSGEITAAVFTIALQKYHADAGKTAVYRAIAASYFVCQHARRPSRADGRKENRRKSLDLRGFLNVADTQTPVRSAPGSIRASDIVAAPTSCRVKVTQGGGPRSAAWSVSRHIRCLIAAKHDSSRRDARPATPSGTYSDSVPRTASLYECGSAPGSNKKKGRSTRPPIRKRCSERMPPVCQGSSPDQYLS